MKIIRGIYLTIASYIDLGFIPEDKSKYTHYAFVFGIPCYWNDNTNTVVGRNNVWDWLLEHIAMPIQHVFIGLLSAMDPYYEPQFMIWMGKEIE